MIIKSFFRNKIVKIYIIILTILVSTLFVLSNFISYYQKLQDELFLNRNILITTSKTNIYDDLSKIKVIDNIKKRVVFLPDKDYNTIVDSQYVLTDTSGNILDSFTTDEKDYEYKISWDKLFVTGFDYILVSSDKDSDRKLSNNEILIGLPTAWKDFYGTHSELYLNKLVGFKDINDNNIEFKIVDLYESHFPQLMISDELYNKIISNQKIFVYTMDILSYKSVNNVLDSINSLDDNSKHFNVTFESSYLDFESNTINNIDDLIGVLKLVSYIILFIFIIIIFIIIKNLLFDLAKEVMLEKRLGFNKIGIKVYIIFRLALLFFIAVCLASVISLFVILAINYFFELDIILFNYIFSFKMIISIILVILLMVLIKKY